MSKEEQNVQLRNEAVSNNETVQPDQNVQVDQSVQQGQTEQQVSQQTQQFSAGQVYVSGGQATNQTSQPIVNTEAAKAKASELAEAAKTGINSYTEKLKTDKKVLGITIAVVVVLVLLIGCVYFTGGSKGVAKNYANAYVKSNSKKIMKYMHEGLVEYYDDLGIDLEETLEDTFDENDDNDYKFLSYELVDSEKLDKDDVEDLAEDLDKAYDIDEDHVKAAVVYTIKYKVKDDGDKDTLKNDITVVKIKGKWYVFPGDLS